MILQVRGEPMGESIDSGRRLTHTWAVMDTEKAATSASEIDRRTFVKAASAAGLGMALGAAPATTRKAGTKPAKRRRYAIVGTGARHQMYQNAIHHSHKEHAELVALCDKNPGRLELARKRAADAGVKVPGYP